ncbi:YadA family autotransporter adhesin [Stenotrophomonas rhizophila]|uniref:YadA family autotransporter adhesin n=1 Tax=Stenotrophomonas rhizophila TaxID=216778 RepID=UPI0027D88E32|nr:YadA-like family protein [Stenotrophomonas rhizophila]
MITALPTGADRPSIANRKSARPSSFLLRNALSIALLDACRSLMGCRSAWVAGVGVLGLAGAPTASADLYINAQDQGNCVRLADPVLINATGASAANQWLSNVSNNDAKCNSNNKGTQTDSALFYRPAGVAGSGATSLSLGGELYLNSGEIHVRQGVLRVGESDGNKIQLGNWATQAQGLNALAIGAAAKGTEAATTAVGVLATSSAARATAVGSASRASGEHASAVGSGASASGTSSLAAGRDARADVIDTVALGYGAKAEHAGSVALGANAQTGDVRALSAVRLNGKAYPIDNSLASGVVSVGSAAKTRQIINMAAGSVNATSTDAVNGSQLHAAYTAINELADKDASLGRDIASLGTRVDAADRQLNDRVDALSVRAGAAMQSVADTLGEGTALSTDGKLVMPSIELDSVGDARTNHSTVLGAIKALDAQVKRADVALGDVYTYAEATAGQAAKSAAQLEGLAPGETVVGTIDKVRQNALMWAVDTGTYSASHDGKAPNRISNVAAGQAPTDAVNKGQLDQVAKTADAAQAGANAAVSAAAAADRKADAAAATASAAGTKADAATAAASAAGSKADAATTAATTAGTKADAATAAAAVAENKADAATAVAEAAASKADAANVAAASAGQKADAASSDAAKALETASAAQVAAQDSGDKIDAALAASTAATERADEAIKKSDGAAAVAQAARDDSADARRIAEGAQTAAQTAGNKADAATTAAAEAGTKSDAATAAAMAAGNRADQAVATADGASAAATAAGTRAEQAIATADGASKAAAAAGTRADQAIATADGAAAMAQTSRDDSADARRIAEGAQTAAQTAGNKADAATTAAVEAGTKSDAATAAATAAGTRADQAIATADGAAAMAQTSRDDSADARRIAEGAQTAAQTAGSKADAATTAAAEAGTKSDAATAAAMAAGNRADQAVATADGAAAMAQTSRDDSADARRIAEGAQTAAQTAGSKADAATTAAAEAGTKSDAATAAAMAAGNRADQAVATADAAMLAASSARTDAGTAVDIARTAKTTSDAAKGKADVAIITAGKAEGTASTALDRAEDASSAAQSAKTIAAAAQRGTEQVAAALGAGASMSNDGTLIAPVYGIGSIDFTGRRTDAGAPIRDVGSALSQVDANVGVVNDRVTAAQDDIRRLRDGSATDGADAPGRAARVAAGTDAVALGADAVATASNSVALGAGSHAERVDTVSVGRAGAERQVTHVADGSRDTDAVNVRQTSRMVRSAAAQVLNQANQYTDRQIQQVRREAKAGIAVAMAASGLPLQSAPGSRSVAIAGATYGGESALAIGLQSVSEDGGFIFKASGSMGADGDSGASVGVGFSW